MFGEDDTHLYQWVQGIDGLGNAVGCWQRVRGQAAAAPYVRRAAPFLGEVAAGPDGEQYQWVQGVDGLGNPFGFWKRLRSLAKRALPIARQFAPFVPGASAALTAATPFLRQVGVEGPDGLGALYEAPDGSMYQVQGIDAGDDLDGLADDDELRGLSEEELQGLAADDELNGFGADEELQGIGAAEDALEGVDAAEDDISGLADEEPRLMGDDDPAMSGYTRESGTSGVEGFLPDQPPRTPAFSASPNAPMWAPLW